MKEKIYNIVICILAIVSVFFAIKEFYKPLTQTEILTDWIIYFIFAIDYIIRFCVSEEKKSFIRSNVFDLIAILPFNSSFRIFRTFKFLRLSKFARFTKFFRIGSLFIRLLNKTKVFLNTNGFKYMLMLSASFIFLGAVGMVVFENMSFMDALWWSFVTTTTVGYGDLSPSSAAGRVIAVILMIVGIGLIGSLTSSITSYFLNSSKNAPQPCSDRVDMVLLLYDSLSDEEKELFKNNI